jgi:SOS response regulatory protein OraA/RecX
MSDDFQAALAVALRRLETSDRFESEVRRALSRYDEPVVERVLSYLRERRFLDERRTVENAVVFNEGRRAVGAEKIRATLERRGAPEDLLQEAVSQTAQGDAARADALLAARYPEPKREDRVKAGRFLYGRGFGEETIESALERHFGSGDADF